MVRRTGRDRGSKLIEPATSRHFAWRGVHLALYAPWWAPSRRKRELGFMIRMRDPRAPCQHRCAPVWMNLERSRARCSRCREPLEICDRKVVHRPEARWRWLKVFVAKTSPNRKRHKHGVVVAEVESHLTKGLAGRLTTKTFLRLKLGVGGKGV